MARAKKSSDLVEAVFIRDTHEREGEVRYKRGDVAELSQASFDRWARRGACTSVAEAQAAAEAEAASAEKRAADKAE